MTFNLQGKKAFITGSTSGIGLSIAQKLQDYGCKIAINSKNKESIENAKKLFKNPVNGIVGDMTSSKDSRKAIEEFIELYKTLDILICNVGSGKSAYPCLETTDDWSESISLNLFSATNPISAAIKYLTKSEGVITCISTICSNKMIENAPITYSCAKAALNRYIENSSFYFAKKNIRINAISPGNVLFPGSTWEEKLIKDRYAVETMIKRKVPLNKFVTPKDISEAVAFLSSPLSCSTTGQVLNVDAGQSII